jgi:glycosyltransferase involved in cell wall biosynthesis
MARGAEPAATSEPSTEATRPSISVVVPTRDREAELARALRSIVDQDYLGEIECVVVFDRTEPTAIPDLARPGRTLRAIRNRRTPGPAGARNAGAQEASGTLIAFCDDDDTWAREKLRLQVEALRSTPPGGAVTCGVIVRFGDRTVERVPAAGTITLDDLVRVRAAEIHTSSLLVRREDYFGAVGPLEESMPGGYGEDYEWLLRAARRQPLRVVRRPLVHVNWHDASWFDGRWDVIVAGIERLLELHPEIRRSRAGLARLYGRLAFATAAQGNRAEAWRWIARTVSTSVGERRAYLAAAVTTGLVPAQVFVRAAHRRGRGI